MNQTDQLIQSLSTDLAEVKPVRNIDRLALIWLACSAVYVVAVIHLLGPIRPGAFGQLLDYPRYAVEMFCGLAAITFVTLSAFRAAVPGALSPRFALGSIALLAIWTGCYLFGLYSPALEPSMLGKRHGCIYETFIYAIPPVATAFWLTRKLFPLRPVYTAAFFSLAAGMIPALYMQIACMYLPSHILKFHILPGLLVGCLGASFAWALYRSREAA